MIKFVHCLRRRPHLSRAEFQRWWLDQHGPLMRNQQHVRGERRYVQWHTDIPWAEAETPRGAQDPYDGFTETWFDSLDAWRAARATVAGSAAVAAARADHAPYIDPTRSILMIATIEHRLLEPPAQPVAAWMHCLVRRAGTREAFQRWWLGEHAPLVLRHAPERNLSGYIQSHPLPEWRDEVAGAAAPERYDGFALTTWPSTDARAAADASPAGSAALQAMRAHSDPHIDRARSCGVLVRQHVIIDEPHG